VIVAASSTPHRASLRLPTGRINFRRPAQDRPFIQLIQPAHYRAAGHRHHRLHICRSLAGGEIVQAGLVDLAFDQRAFSAGPGGASAKQKAAGP
jgi:hypothetical protein